MVPLQWLALEHHSREDSEDSKGYHFLDYFQLHEVERTSVFCKSDPVRRNLGTVFEECDSP